METVTLNGVIWLIAIIVIIIASKDIAERFHRNRWRNPNG